MTEARATTATAASIFSREFDDLLVGDRFDSQGRTITEADVVAFAALTGDRHPQHVDAEWAATRRFGARIAHGMLILSYGLGLLPLDPERIVAMRRVRDAVFKRPVWLGDTIHIDGRIAEIEPLDDDHGLVSCRLKIVNQSEEAVARARVEVVWRRRRQASDAAGKHVVSGHSTALHEICGDALPL